MSTLVREVEQIKLIQLDTIMYQCTNAIKVIDWKSFIKWHYGINVSYSTYRFKG